MLCILEDMLGGGIERKSDWKKPLKTKSRFPIPQPPNLPSPASKYRYENKLNTEYHQLDQLLQHRMQS